MRGYGIGMKTISPTPHPYLISAVIAALALLQWAVPAVETTDPPRAEKQIADLVRSLDSDEFDQREAAQAALEVGGRELIPILVRAMESEKSLEIRIRLTLCARKILLGERYLSAFENLRIQDLQESDRPWEAIAEHFKKLEEESQRLTLDGAFNESVASLKGSVLGLELANLLGTDLRNVMALNPNEYPQNAYQNNDAAFRSPGGPNNGASLLCKIITQIGKPGQSEAAIKESIRLKLMLELTDQAMQLEKQQQGQSSINP